MGQQEFTSCGLNLRFLCPAVVISVELFKMAAEDHAEQKYAGSISVSLKLQLLNVVFI